MATTEVPSLPVSLANDAIPARSLWQMMLRRFMKHRMALIGFFILVGILLYITIGSLVFTEAYANYNDTSLRLQPPYAEHPFGTDTVGRDILARTVYGGQISLIIGILAVAGGVTLGSHRALRLYGGRWDSI
jgi:peptide/nickel transport system permease protein